MNFFHTRIKDQKISSIEEQIITFINNNYDSFVYMSISQVSAKLYISLGAITKFTHKMGFQSFKHLQIYIAQESIRHNLLDLSPDWDNIDSHIKNMKIYYDLAIGSTSDYLVTRDLRTAGELLKSAQNIYTYGVGGSSLAAEIISNNLNILGKNSKILQNAHDFIESVDLKKKNKTIVILFSNTLQTPEVLLLLNLCEQHEIVTIVITNNRTRKDTLTTLIIKFNLFESEIQNTTSTFTPKISQLYVVDVLCSWLKHIISYKPDRISRDLII